MRSMTGYGRARGEIEGIPVVCEIQSFNHKYTDVTINLPPQFEQCRVELARKVKERVKRGAIFVKVYAENEGEGFWVIDMDAVRNYKRQIEEDVRIAELLPLPGVVKEKRFGEDACMKVCSLLDHAIDKLLEMREKEGEALKSDLLRKIEKIEGIMEEMEERIRKDVEEERKRIEERMEVLRSAGMNLTKDEVLLLITGGVNEEVVRIKSHLQQMKEYLDEDSPGRKLLFLTQELQRELNTLGTKLSNPSLTHQVLELREIVEEIKEQVMNVE